MSLTEQLHDLILPALESLGYELYELGLTKDLKELKLNVRVDRVGSPIGLDDIVKVSEALSALLDQANLISENYVLDVSSAGAERTLKPQDLTKRIGHYVNLHLSVPYHGENILEGEILAATETSITLGVRQKTRLIKTEIRLADVDRARLAIKF